MTASSTGNIISRRIIQPLSRTGRDSYYLWTALFQNLVRRNPSSSGGSSSSLPYSSRIKDVLLAEARTNHNVVATSLLRAQQEYGLMKYHGLRPYIQQRIESWRTTTTLFGRNNDTSNSTITTHDEITDSIQSSTREASLSSPSGGTTAKVAFMITSSMKQNLKDELKYTVDDIKRMTPQQASLVLFHQVPPELFDEQISSLEKEFLQQQEQRQKQEEEAKRKAAIEETLSVDVRDSTTVEDTVSKTSQDHEDTGNSQQLALPPASATAPSLQTTSEQHAPPSEDSYPSSLESSRESLSSASSSSSNDVSSTTFGEKCYEVVEQKADGTEVRVGLYLDHNEAQLGLETRQMISDKQYDNREKNQNNSTVAVDSEENDNDDSKNDGTSGRSVFVLRPISKDQL